MIGERRLWPYGRSRSELQVPDQGATVLAALAVHQLAEFLRAHLTPTSRVRLCADEPDSDAQIVVP
ncbi:MAG: hypothetical protein ACRDZ3_13315 [Acidimicrobiia bacterium]